MYDLDEKQKLFCEKIVEGKSPQDAAISAGYAKSMVTSSPYKWLKDARFIEYIEYLKKHEGYPIENYIRDINKCLELADNNETTKANSRLRIITQKGRAYGYNNKTVFEHKAENNQQKQQQETKTPEDTTYRTIEERIYKNPYLKSNIPTAKQREFLLNDKREILYGGAAGGGKSAALLMAALMYVDVPNYKALLLRRTYSQLDLPCALMDMARQWLDHTDAKWNANKKQWTFPSGATLTFGYLDTDRDKYRYQGAAFHFIGFDELTQFTERQYTYLFSRSRKSLTTDIPLRFRAASNPGGIGHEWVKTRFIEEKKPDRAFIPAGLDDNPYLDREEYEKNLKELDPVTRKQLRDGDWKIQASGNFFKRERFQITEDYPKNGRIVRYWDLAASEKLSADYTAGVKICAHKGRYWILDVVRAKSSPAGIEDLIKQTAELDGKHVEVFMEQEPGSSGKNSISHYARNILTGFSFTGIHSTGKKAERARPFAAAVENSNVQLLHGLWNKAFIEECVVFPQDGYHDDQVDAASGAFTQLNSSSDSPAIIESFKISRKYRGLEGY